MGHFQTALSTVVARSFGEKQTALGVASGLGQSEISRLLRGDTPCTAAKLEKLCAAVPVPDRTLLVEAAVRDFVPDDVWEELYSGPPEERFALREGDGTTFHADFPISPRATQVLRYLITHAQSDPDVVDALELLGKFLKLPDPL